MLGATWAWWPRYGTELSEFMANLGARPSDDPFEPHTSKAATALPRKHALSMSTSGSHSTELSTVTDSPQALKASKRQRSTLDEAQEVSSTACTGPDGLGGAQLARDDGDATVQLRWQPSTGVWSIVRLQLNNLLIILLIITHNSAFRAGYNLRSILRPSGPPLPSSLSNTHPSHRGISAEYPTVLLYSMFSQIFLLFLIHTYFIY